MTFEEFKSRFGNVLPKEEIIFYWDIWKDAKKTTDAETFCGWVEKEPVVLFAEKIRRIK